MCPIAALRPLFWLLAAAAPAAAQAALPMGTHRMALDCPGGELPFRLRLEGDGQGGLVASIHNGGERIDVPDVFESDGAIVARFPHYDSELRLDVRDGALAGEWIKRRGEGPTTRMGVRSTGGPRRFAGEAQGGDDALAGRYRVAFAKSAAPAVGVFRRARGPYHDFEGTFLTTLGDYRFLAGNTTGGGFALSCFDGAHAFLFTAERTDDGGLRGDFWSSDSWHETWTATPDDDAALPDGFALTRWRDGRELADAAFRDLDGGRHTLAERGLEGTVRVIELFGTWCPNCHDHGAYMAELDRRYGPRGLRIVGVAFEHDEDDARSTRQVRAFAERHGARYPIWIGGLSDKRKASEALGLLDRVRAFPTTLFVDRAGTVRAVHQGFSGPATGDAHRQLRRRFEQLIERLLAE